MNINIFGDKVKKEVKIKREAFEKMLALSEEMQSSEVGGLIICSEEENLIIVEDIIVPEQEASSGDVVMDAERVAEILQPFIKTKPEIWAKCKGWWHSHGMMDTFWSSTDEQNITDLLTQFSPVISIVTNAKGSMRTRIDDKVGNGLKVIVDEINPLVEQFSPKSLSWVKQQRKKIKESKTFWQRKQWKKWDDVEFQNQPENIQQFVEDNDDDASNDLVHKPEEQEEEENWNYGN